MTIIIPEGRATGCLPRESEVGERIPRASRERIPIVLPGDWRELADCRYLERWPRDVNQNGYPACCLASEANAVQFTCAAADSSEPIPECDWHAAWADLAQNRRSGVALDTAIAAAMQDGIPLVDGGKAMIREAYDAKTIEEFASALLRGFFCTFGHDGHAECALPSTRRTPRGGLEFLTRNSWGRDWGDGGYHWYPLDKVEIETYGAIIICRVEVIWPGK